MTDSRWLNELSKTYVGDKLNEARETEDVIISIAEQLGVHPKDLLNELNVGGAIKSGYKAGGVIDAIKAGANAVGVNRRQAGQAKDGINLGTTNQRLAGVARKAGEKVRGAPRIFIPGWHGPIRDPNAIVRGRKTEDRLKDVAGTHAGRMAAKNGFALGLHIKESNLEELVEQQLQEHEDYISTLETMLALVVEEFDIDVESLVEAAKKPMPKKPMPKKPSLTAAQLKALGMTRTAERAAARGTGGSASAVGARTAALKKLEQVASTAAGRNALKRFG